MDRRRGRSLIFRSAGRFECHFAHDRLAPGLHKFRITALDAKLSRIQTMVILTSLQNVFLHEE